ncbi:MAG: alkaline phosphatase D family protein [Corynebacterium sp.]|uniref:alkaline phosphatase D family protein n=1 Tax=Corynebacterium sp. TaxID=1720 RepID=UPI0026DB5194|nr:alkaline phosphatase D family protein [Corynebacterium sp.]MDO4761373.1 alkaline phosphatase D family protein [Corynebacterium sp.]
MSTISRKNFLRTAALASASSMFTRAFTADAQQHHSNAPHAVFCHGVASGDPLPTSVVLWTRVTPEPEAFPGSGRGPDVPVRWEIARDLDFSSVVASGNTLATSASDHTVHVDPFTLEPDTLYFYRFHALGQVSPIGRTRTAPAANADVEQLRIAVCSCANWESGYFSAYRDLAERAQAGLIDIAIHVGDYIYEYERGKMAGKLGAVRAHQPPWETVSLADYRLRYGTYRTDPDLQAAHAAVPWVVTWDDHEIADNAYRDGAKNHQPHEGDYSLRRRNAMQAYFEWQPLRAGNPSEGGHLYRRLNFGQLAELVMLDLRSYRASYGDIRWLTGTNAPDVMGGEQFAWLERQIATSTASWRLVGNSVMLAKLELVAVPHEVRTALQEMIGHDVRTPVMSDQWDGYTSDRERLLSMLSSLDSRTVFFTGDIHSEWGNEIVHNDAVVAAEMVCTSVSAMNVDDYLFLPEFNPLSTTAQQHIMQANNHVKHVQLDAHGYCIATITKNWVEMAWLRVANKADPHSAVTVAAQMRYDGHTLHP